jgi:RHS repeat-associated protein
MSHGASDALGRLTTITNADASSATISQYGYAYDNLNRVTTHTYDSAIGTYTYNGVKTYTYDHTSQVIGDSGSTFTYDAQGNRTMPGYATGAANRLTNDGVFTYTYDAEGNCISKSKGSGLETWYYTWDTRNRLIGVEQTSDGASILLAVTYTYDAHDKLVAEEKWQSSTGVVTTRRHWDGEDLWAITDASNVVAARYLYGDGVDQVQGRIVEAGPNAGTQGFYATDNLGSVRDIIDAATGEVLFHAEYDAFGAATEYGAGYGDTLKYTAREFDADTGLQYNRARWYDNTTGRWLSEDPIGFAAGDHNLYRYVSNFATGATDPSGQEIVTICIIVGCVVTLTGVGCLAVAENNYNSATAEMQKPPALQNEGKIQELAQSGDYYSELGFLLGVGGIMTVATGPLSVFTIEMWAAGGIAQATAFSVTGTMATYGGQQLVSDIWNWNQLSPAQRTSMIIQGVTAFGVGAWFARPHHANLGRNLATRLHGRFAPLRGPRIIGANGQPLRALPANSITAGEAAEIQAIANRYNTTIDVVGSRTAGQGRNVGTILPAGKGPGTRSDIDFRIDAAHPQADALIADLQGVGSGAGTAGPRWGTNPATAGGRATEPPYIRFSPEQ